MTPPSRPLGRHPTPRTPAPERKTARPQWGAWGALLLLGVIIPVYAANHTGRALPLADFERACIQAYRSGPYPQSEQLGFDFKHGRFKRDMAYTMPLVVRDLSRDLAAPGEWPKHPSVALVCSTDQQRRISLRPWHP